MIHHRQSGSADCCVVGLVPRGLSGPCNISMFVNKSQISNSDLCYRAVAAVPVLSLPSWTSWAPLLLPTWAASGRPPSTLCRPSTAPTPASAWSSWPPGTRPACTSRGCGRPPPTPCLCPPPRPSRRPSRGTRCRPTTRACPSPTSPPTIYLTSSLTLIDLPASCTRTTR